MATGKQKRKRKRIGQLRYGTHPSKPGHPPHKQTGRLKASVSFEVLDSPIDGYYKARVGTNVKYGRHLEFGTGKMAPRPWLRRSYLACKSAITQILAKPMNLPKNGTTTGAAS